jgi:glycyl-tRNA synthetase beta chain
LVADALDQQYKPRFAGDDLPNNELAQSLAIADKLDTIVGIFRVGQIPTGDKDPFALRRAALGLLRIIIEKELDLDVKYLINESLRMYRTTMRSSRSMGTALRDVNSSDLESDIYEFMIERTKSLLCGSRH